MLGASEVASPVGRVTRYHVYDTPSKHFIIILVGMNLNPVISILKTFTYLMCSAESLITVLKKCLNLHVLLDTSERKAAMLSTFTLDEDVSHSWQIQPYPVCLGDFFRGGSRHPKW